MYPTKKPPYKYNADPFLFCLLCTCLFTLCLIQMAIPSAAFAKFEQPTTLRAKEILKPDILKGPYHTVDEAVKNDGLFNYYTIKSEYGDFKVSSTLSLQARVLEINAIGEMVKVETDDTVGKSFGESAENTVEGVKHLFKDPKDTLEGAGAGIGSLFNRAKETIGKRELADAEDSRIEQLVGISKSKGEIATKYGVNMYSRNKRLQKELDRLGRADFLGGLGTTVAKSFIPGVGGLLLSTSDAARLLNETINTTPASELWLQNKNKLLAMKINPDTITLFLNNPVFSPAQETVLVAALEKLKGVANRDLCIKVALQASEVDMALAITRIVVMSAGYHQNISPLKRFEPLARITRAVGKNGSVVVLLPADFIIWSEKAADVFGTLVKEQGKLPQGAGFELWSLGTFSKRAHSELQGMGWKIQTGASKKLSLKK